MKLCLNTYNLAGNKTIEEIIDLCQKAGIGGIEFSVGYGHCHGVEFDSGSHSWRATRDQVMAAGLETVSIASYCRFDMQDETELRKNLTLAKQGIDCAEQMDARIFRFVANDLPDFQERNDFLAFLSSIIIELSDYAKPKGIDVLLNMHGSFNHRNDVAKVIERANCENCGLVYNCADEDVIGGSLEVTISRIHTYIKHVHLHELVSGYPYRDLFRLLNQYGYSGWRSIAVDDPSAEVERYLRYYVALAISWNNEGEMGGRLK